MKRKLTVPEKHGLKIARDTLRMPDVMARIMGGPTKEEAKRIIRKLTDKDYKMVKVTIVSDRQLTSLHCPGE